MSKKVKSGRSKQEGVFIANPLYDHVLKYLMEDDISARKFLSAIIGEEVVKLSFAPKKYVEEMIKVQERTYNIYRLYFTARIRTADSDFLTVMIELQKVSSCLNSTWLKRYLDSEYQNKENSYPDKGKRPAKPVYCIFFIGGGLGIKGVPVIEVNPIAVDVITGKPLQNIHNEFMMSLRHRSWIIQIPELTGYCRNDLEILLGIFDKKNRMNDGYTMNIKAGNFPEEYYPIIRRLQEAALSEKIRNAMLADDDILEHFRIAERIMLIKLDEKDKIIAEKEALIAEKKAAIAREREKEAAIAEKEAAIAREREEKEAL
jgi:hypothetical protein